MAAILHAGEMQLLAGMAAIDFRKKLEVLWVVYNLNVVFFFGNV